MQVSAHRKKSNGLSNGIFPLNGAMLKHCQMR